MAEILSEWPTTAEKQSRSKYPWTEWADGQIRRLHPGADFQCKATTLKSQATTWAQEHGYTATAGIEPGDTVVLKMAKKAE